MKKINRRDNETKLERHVRCWINRNAKDYDTGVEGVMKDLMHGGCQSGYVGELIYTVDCVRFYRLHGTEIDTMLYELLADADCHVWELFRDWDKEDPLGRGEYNQNQLAWFGFEEMAQRVASAAEM